MSHQLYYVSCNRAGDFIWIKIITIIFKPSNIIIIIIIVVVVLSFKVSKLDIAVNKELYAIKWYY